MAVTLGQKLVAQGRVVCCVWHRPYAKSKAELRPSVEWGLQHLGRALEMDAPISDAFAPFDVLTLLTLFLAMATMALGTLLTAGARARASKRIIFLTSKVFSALGMEGVDHVFGRPLMLNALLVGLWKPLRSYGGLLPACQSHPEFGT